MGHQRHERRNRKRSPRVKLRIFARKETALCARNENTILVDVHLVDASDEPILVLVGQFF